MTWPRERGSPMPIAVSAADFSAAKTATPSLTGSRAESCDITSGAGRSETRRSDSARRRRSATEAGSSSQASFCAAAASSASPMVSRASGSPASLWSTSRRCSRARQAVSRAMSVARHSVIRPVWKAAQVWGSSVCRIMASPRWREPLWWDSRRASAIWAAIPRERRSAGTPASAAWAIWDSAKSAVKAAWAASVMHLSSSSPRSRSIRSASLSAGVGRSRTCAWVAPMSNMCSMIVVATDSAAGARRRRWKEVSRTPILPPLTRQGGKTSMPRPQQSSNPTGTRRVLRT